MKRRSFITTPHGRLAYWGDDIGSSAVLLLHGLYASGDLWESVTPQLRGACALTALDLPGHGLSAPCRNGSPMDCFVKAVGHLLRASDTAPVTIVGHSLGGLLALLLACDAPERISGVLLLGTPLELPAVSRPLRLLALPGAQVALHYLNHAQLSLHALASKLYARQQSEWRGQLAEWAGMADRDAVFRLVNDLVGYDWTALSRQVREKGVCLGFALARDDRTVSTPRMLRNPVVRTAQPVLLPGGHMLPLEQPSAVADVILGRIGMR